MMTLFKRKFSAAHADAAHVPSRRYVHAIMLENVEEPFDAASLWERARPLLGDPHRLKSLLDQHTFRVGQDKQVFANVVVELPADEVEHDRRIASGERGRHLADELQQLHSTSFGRRLAGAGTPRYAIRPGHDLAPGTARVRFGHGVYVPNDADRTAWRIEVSTDGVIWSLAGDIQEAQRLLILGGSTEAASVVVDGWPFPADQSIVLVNEPGNLELDVSAEPVRSLTVNCDENTGCHVIESVGHELRLYVRAAYLLPKAVPKLAAPKPAAAPLIVVPAQGLFHREPSLGEPQLNEADELVAETDETASGTFVPTRAEPEVEDGTFLPSENQPRHRMTLVGIALQRVSSYHKHGIEGLSFAFSAGGKIMPPAPGGRHLGFRIGDDDRLYAETSAGKRAVNIGEKLPMPDGGHISLEALPPEMDEHYLAWCRLPTPVSEAIGVGARFAVGRGAQPVLSALRVLGGKGFLVSNRDTGADRMGLSRRHFLMEVAAEGLVITPIAKNCLIHLDEDFGFVEQIDIATKPTSLVPPGHHIVVGHYLMRYDA